MIANTTEYSVFTSEIWLKVQSGRQIWAVFLRLVDLVWGRRILHYVRINSNIEREGFK